MRRNECPLGHEVKMKFPAAIKRKEYCPRIAVKSAFIACSQEYGPRVAAPIEVIWQS
jgi:hypothetical protein